MTNGAYMSELTRTIDNSGCRDSQYFLDSDNDLDKNRVSFVFDRRLRNLIGRRKLGIAWLILDPIFYSLIYLFVLTVVRTSPDPRILFIGVSMFRVFSSSFKSGTNSVSDFSGGIKAERVRTKVIRNSLFRFRVFDSVIQGSGVAIILFFLDVKIIGVLSYAVLCIIMSIMAEGVGLNLSLILRRMPDLKDVINNYFMLLLFFGSPAFYSMSITTGVHYKVNEFNPFAYFVEMARHYCGTESEMMELIGLNSIIVMILVLFLAIRGYLVLDRQRWEESYWS